MFQLTIRTEAQMLKLGEYLGERVKPGDLLFLFGELGAGKTTLTKGIAKGLGVVETVTSPTFQLKKSYFGVTPFNHLDLYRIVRDEELDILEPDEWLEESVTVVEWGKLLMERIEGNYLEIIIEVDPDSQRRSLRFVPHGIRYQGLLEGLCNVDLGN